jgi:hypothetical protein
VLLGGGGGAAGGLGGGEHLGGLQVRDEELEGGKPAMSRRPDRGRPRHTRFISMAGSDEAARALGEDTAQAIVVRFC